MNNQVALVTGAGRGIGRGIAVALAERGWTVVVNYRGNAQAATETVRLIEQTGGRGVAVQANIAETTERQRLVNEVVQAFARLDLLVNNAGMAPRQRLDILETSETSYDEVMTVNLKGPFFLTQQIAQLMIDQLQAGIIDQPKIVNISSISAYTSSPNRGEYCLSKAGISMLTALFADRLAEFGINVYEIRPGIIETDMTSGVKEKYDDLIGGGLTPIRRWGRPDDIGRAVVAIAEGYLPFSTGEVINVDGGFHLHRL
ncbi:MAG: 3-ketoacyl-ACP reductase [Anaerolineae bacterium]|nr:3-ketoacyl-ACP reductase [Anaerolineae bacterium]